MLLIMATAHSMQLHGSISYGDGARCWENAFQAFGSAKILLGEDPGPRMGFATSVLAGSGSTRHGLPPQAKNSSYAPAEAHKSSANLLFDNYGLQLLTEQTKMYKLKRTW